MLLDAHGHPIGSTPIDEEQLLALVVEEIRQIGRTPLILGPFAAAQGLQLAGVVQLAMRHPDLGPDARLLAATIVDAIREYFSDAAPATLELLARGDDPAQGV